jgi:imidazolonepropionase-like amidohydrolase
VLEATTTMAAEYHGEHSNTGKIAPNMVADIVVLSGNPTQDISATRKIDTVLTRGTILRRSSIEKGMARIADRFRAMPI